MVTEIIGDNVDEIFIKLSRKLLKDGVKNDPRGLTTLEIPNCFIQLNDPNRKLCNLEERDINMKYLIAEMDWYFSGSLNVKDIEKHSNVWSRLADSNGTINSNYGFLVFKEKWAGKSQFEWCINSLKKDINTRQAVMVYNQPRHKYKGVKDFPCTLSQQFIVRNGKLDSVVHMRSNDLIFGFTYDVYWFCRLQEMVSEATGIPLGKYYHFASSMHVYKRHFDIIKKISEVLL